VNAPVVRRATPDDAHAIATVRIESWRATYRGMIPDAYLDALSIDENAGFWRRILASGSPNVTVYVADDAGEVVGFASANRRDPPKLGFDGELSAIYVRGDRKRQGIGRRLVAAVAAAERARGAGGLVVFVIAGNRDARAFYENLGAELLLEEPFEWDGIPLVEAAYAWRDLDALIAAGGGAALLH
jgi:ribosomal protein S18 acetylase RimI-like enzyme